MLLRKRAKSRDNCEDETVQNLLPGDTDGGVELDKHGPQLAQRGRK